MVSNGMVNFLHLGRYWGFGVLAFASVAFADFSSSDSSNLANIRDYIYQDIKPDIHAIRTTLYDSSTGTGIKSDVSQVRYWLGILLEATTTPPEIGYRVVRVQDKPAEQSLSIITNQNNQILSAINNLTNYLCYSPQYLAESFTNIAVNLGYFGMGNYNNWPDNSARIVFKYLYGYTPNSTELLNFKQYVQNYGPGLQFRQEFYSEVPYLSAFDFINITYNNKSYNLGTLWNRYKAESVPETAQAFVHAQGNMRYYAYGTREFTDSFNMFTNALFNGNSEFSSSGSPSSLFQSQYDEARQSFIEDGYVSTNVASLDFGEITNRPNHAIIGATSIIEGGLDPSISQDIESILGQKFSEFTALVPNESDNSLTLDFGSFSVFGNKPFDITFTFSKPPEVVSRTISFLFFVIKAGISLYTGLSIWRYMFTQTTL